LYGLESVNYVVIDINLLSGIIMELVECCCHIKLQHYAASFVQEKKGSSLRRHCSAWLTRRTAVSDPEGVWSEHVFSASVKLYYKEETPKEGN
jgi:hypothetical protein